MYELRTTFYNSRETTPLTVVFLVASAAVLARSLRGEGEGGDAQADPATQETIQVT
jgi:hypothetical protein